MLLLSLYSHFPVPMLFGVGQPTARFAFLGLPVLSKFMTYSRYKTLLRYVHFAVTPPRPEDQHTVFWKVQPLIDTFNEARSDRFVASWKLCVDESMSPWRGKDHRHGDEGCPHVTKIIRKPKGVGMEIKNLCDVDSGIMLRIEIVGPKEEMNDREYTRALGAGTALLLRLTKDFRGSGRIVVADSAFASVKSAVQLKSRGLNFLGLVKTASRKFPKTYLQAVDLEERGDHYVLTATEADVDLRAVTWNEGKKDNKTGKIIRKNFIATCGTTLEAPPHKKKRWNTIAMARPPATQKASSSPRSSTTTSKARKRLMSITTTDKAGYSWSHETPTVGTGDFSKRLSESAKSTPSWRTNVSGLLRQKKTAPT